MNTSYETDVVAWANEQARLLRSGQLSALDTENLAEEVEAMGRSERRELESRMAVLLAHLLKWKYQPGRRSPSWSATLSEQRMRIRLLLRDSPSLKPMLTNQEWLAEVMEQAIVSAAAETGLNESIFQKVCPWTVGDVLTQGWYPAD